MVRAKSPLTIESPAIYTIKARASVTVSLLTGSVPPKWQRGRLRQQRVSVYCI